ncbi:MAG: AraC family transcriptional regulator, partial [Nakamurella sp.]
SPDGLLATLDGPNARFIGPSEAFWVHRATSHHVRAGEQQTVYRLCLRQVPTGVDGLLVGPVSVDHEAARLIQTIARPGYGERAALAARGRIMAGLTTSAGNFSRELAAGAGYARAVARELTHDPGNDRQLDEWAAELHISAKTLQRDFRREFGTSYSRWRTKLRLQAARVLLESDSVAKVATRVGYSSPSAFISAFANEFGHTPGGRASRARLN